MWIWPWQKPKYGDTHIHTQKYKYMHVWKFQKINWVVAPGQKNLNENETNNERSEVVS